MNIIPALVGQKLLSKSFVAMTSIPLNIVIEHIGIDGREHEFLPQIYGHVKFNSRIKNGTHFPWA